MNINTTITTTAMDVVFNIPELAELIISQMHINDLIAATAVCRGWQDLIFRSQSMQARLVYDPLPTTAEGNDMEWNREGGGYWLMRLSPSENDSNTPKSCDLLIYRTSEIHIELLLKHSGGQPVIVNSRKTQILQRHEGRHILKEATWFDADGQICWSSLLEQTTGRPAGSALRVFRGDDGKFSFSRDVAHTSEIDWKFRKGSGSRSNWAVLLAYLRTYYAS